MLDVCVQVNVREENEIDGGNTSIRTQIASNGIVIRGLEGGHAIATSECCRGPSDCAVPVWVIRAAITVDDGPGCVAGAGERLRKYRVLCGVSIAHVCPQPIVNLLEIGNPRWSMPRSG